MSKYVVMTHTRGPIEVYGDATAVNDRGDLEIVDAGGKPQAAFGAGEWRFAKPAEEPDGNASR